MQQSFEAHIHQNKLFTKNTKLLLAVSGGLDSVVLAYLLKEGKYEFSLAHANFNLRGKESEADEKFCQTLAKKLNVPIYIKAFDVKSYRETKPSGIQEAARNLRYTWFNELLIQTKSTYLLTAHHANDMIETVLLNLLRGTGINGIKGIPETNGKIIRPLLPFEKEEIVKYAKQKGIKFRTDKSNLEAKYKRNFIRLNVIPLLKELNPKLEQTFINNSKHFREEANIVNDFLANQSLEYITQTHDAIFVNKQKLKKEKYIKSVLHFILTGYGFNVSQENGILKNILSNSLSGKNFMSPTHQLFVDRNDLVIKTIQKIEYTEQKFMSIKDLNKNGTFSYSLTKKFKLPKKNEIFLNPAQLIFPLTVRLKQTGDKFKPFGMKGFKLLSDFIKSEKLNLSQKENCKVLINGNNEIIWVIGYRSDERYRVDTSNEEFIKLSVSE